MREEMPIGFGFALAENEKAMSSFAKMTEEEKKQVMDMTRRLLKLSAVPRPDDAADALAIAICHARSATSLLRRKDPNVKETV